MFRTRRRFLAKRERSTDYAPAFIDPNVHHEIVGHTLTHPLLSLAAVSLGAICAVLYVPVD
jgi:hypothetical protein